jgi:hypothetical protein
VPSAHPPLLVAGAGGTPMQKKSMPAVFVHS